MSQVRFIIEANSDEQADGTIHQGGGSRRKGQMSELVGQFRNAGVKLEK